MGQRKGVWVVLSLPLAVVLYVLGVASYGLWATLYGSSGSWSVGFMTVVEASDSAGLGTGLADLLGLALTVVVWGAAALTTRWTPRHWRPVLAVGVLSVPLLACAGAVRSAHATSPDQVLEAHGFSPEQGRLMREHTQAMADYRSVVPRWLAGLPAGARPSLAPSEQLRVTWQDLGYLTPFEGIRFVVPLAVDADARGAGRLVVLMVDDGGGASLADLPRDTHATGVPSPVPFARQVDGVAVSPDGTRIAYRTDAEGHADSLVVRTVTGRVLVEQKGVTASVVGWNTAGILTRSADLRSTQVWAAPGPDATPGVRLRPQAVVTSGELTDVVQAPSHSNRVLLRHWKQAPSQACPAGPVDAPPFGERPSFDSGPVWPPTTPWYRGGCLTPGADSYAVVVPGRTAPLWTGSAEDAPQSISDDGRYLVLGDLEVVDLTYGTRTQPAPTVTDAVHHLNHTLTAIWGSAADGLPAQKPLAAGFWHRDGSIEVTAAGTVIAVCRVPSGPCRSTGLPLPLATGSS